ncbi:MAG: helix-turn-helix transcriptional regulator [Deltaproteobacteria bacterium]|nr:helix-turn-helix transcriptional regulator [Deltaproteobacteria bacterium]
MSAPTNEPTTTDFVEVRFRIPKIHLNEAKKALAGFGAQETEDSLPWRAVFPHFDAGVALRGARKREGLTQKKLAGRLGVSQTHISEMEHGKRPIGKEMARRLAKVLQVDYRVFL